MSDFRKNKIDPKEQLRIEAKERLDDLNAILVAETAVDTITVNRFIQVYTRDTSSRKKSWRAEPRVLNKEFGEINGNSSTDEFTREEVKKIVTGKRKAGKQTSGKCNHFTCSSNV